MTLGFVIYAAEFQRNKTNDQPSNEKIRITPEKRQTLLRRPFNFNPFQLFFFSAVPEIGKVRGNLFQINGKKTEPLVLPDANGAIVSLSEKVYVPLKDHPDVSLTLVPLTLALTLLELKPSQGLVKYKMII